MKVLVKNEEILEICKGIGEELTKKLKGKTPLVVGVLKGACPFLCELVKYIDLPLEIDYVQISSYVGTRSSGNINIKKDLDIDIDGRDVVIVEDVIDTGITLNNLKKLLETRNPNSLIFVSLLDKPSKREVEFKADYIGKEIDDYFVVGFGIDVNEKYRNLKDICIYKE